MSTDPDCDGATTAEEAAAGSDPSHPDSDGDWVIDGQELHIGRSPTRWEPLSATLAMGETFVYRLAAQPGSGPIDIAFLIDSGHTAHISTALTGEFMNIVEALAAMRLGVHYGYATYVDYAYSSYGYASSGDKPFILQQQITNDIGAVHAAITGTSHHFGGDGPQSSMEALYQGLTGAGYDQNCDGMYETETDVVPFSAADEDPFSGSAGSAGIDTSDGGSIGGFGFRPHSKPIIVYVIDNYMRDPDAGYGTPDGCPLDAGSTNVVDAASAIGATLIGIDGSGDGSGGGAADSQMEALAEATDSVADTDGDGTDEPLVFGGWGSSSEFKDTVANAVKDLLAAPTHWGATFSEVTVNAGFDSAGFVTDWRPYRFDDVEMNYATPTHLRFQVTLTGTVAATVGPQHFETDLVVFGDGGTELDSRTISLTVPASGDR